MPYDHTGRDVASVESLDTWAGFGTAFLNPDRFTLEMGDRIHMLGAASSPFLSWMQMVRTKPTGQYNFSWIESELFTQRDIKATLYRAVEDTVAGDDCNFMLKLQTGADWQAFMAAANADTWVTGEDKPLIFLTIVNPDTPSEKWSAIIRKEAIQLGQITRNIVSDAGPTSFTGVLNAICVYDNTESADTVGGVTGELDEIVDAGFLNGTIDPATAFNPATGYFDDTWFGGDTSTERSKDVWVTIVTPNDYLKGYVQGSGLPTESRKRTRSLRNFTQIFKTPYSISNTVKQIGMNGMLVGGEEMRRIRYNKGIEHKIDIETAILFQGGGVEGTDWGELGATGGGTRYDTGSGGYYGSKIADDENPLTRFKGLGVGLAVAGDTTKPGFIQTKNADLDTAYVFDNTAADMAELNRIMALVFDDNVDNPSSAKTLFCSQKWLMSLAQIGLQIDAANGGIFTFGERIAAPGTLGIIIKQIVTPVGRLDCVHLPRLRGRFEDYAFVVDWNNMEYRPMTGRDTKLKADVATDERDGQVDYYITEAGFECRHESTHAVLKLTA